MPAVTQDEETALDVVAQKTALDMALDANKPEAAAYLRLLDAFQSGRADEAITGVVGGEGGAPAVGGREARQRAERYEVQLSRQQGRVAAAIQAVREARAALAEPVFYGMQVSRRRF